MVTISTRAGHTENTCFGDGMMAWPPLGYQLESSKKPAPPSRWNDRPSARASIENEIVLIRSGQQHHPGQATGGIWFCGTLDTSPHYGLALSLSLSLSIRVIFLRCRLPSLISSAKRSSSFFGWQNNGKMEKRKMCRPAPATPTTTTPAGRVQNRRMSKNPAEKHRSVPFIGGDYWLSDGTGHRGFAHGR